MRINLKTINTGSIFITAFLCMQILTPLSIAAGDDSKFMDFNTIKDWTSEPEGNLDIERTVTKQEGVSCLLWKWQYYTNNPGKYFMRNPEATPTAWDPPAHSKDLRLYYLDNSVTYSNPEAFANIDAKKSGLKLCIAFPPRARLAKGLLRLELLSGDKVVATGMFYESWKRWDNLQMPYRMANGAKITGFRLRAPSHSTPLWSDYAPTCAAIAEVELDSGKSDYNGMEIENFESSALPAGWKPDKNSSLKIDSIRRYSGKSSLRWDWRQKGASIAFNKGNPLPGQTLGMWVYNEKPSDKRLNVEFMKGGKVVFSCWYFMNFKGWHVLIAPFNKLGWKPALQPDSMRITAPEGSASGRVWIDFVNFDARGWPAAWYRPETPCADNQQPWLDNPKLLATPALCSFSTYDLSKGRPWIPALVPKEKIPTDQIEFIEKNTPRPPKYKDVPKRRLAPDKLESALSGIVRWNIKDENGILTGRPIESRFNAPPDAMAAHKDFVDMCADMANACQEASRIQDNEAEKKLLDGLILILRYASDQGQFSQSNNYVPTSLMNFLIPLRDKLPKNLFDEVLAENLFQTGGGGRIFALEPSGDSDVVASSYSNFLNLMFLYNDPSKKLQNIQIFTRAINRICTRGDFDCFGPDGTFFHHNIHHWAYASYEFISFPRFIKFFHGSPFQLDPQCYEICKKYIFTMAWSFCKYTMPSPLLARCGNICTFNMSYFANQMIDAGSPDGKLDRELASLFLALTDKSDSEQAKKYRDMGIEPYRFDGHRTLNGTAAGIQRRDDWMVAVIGLTRYVTGLEIYGGATNSYSSFARNGSVTVVSSGSPTSCQASGWSFEGWDSRHYPNATNRLCKPQELWQGYKYISNGNPFAGGTDLDNDGIWGFDLQAEGISAKKSAFCFDRRVTLITTGVKRGTSDKGNDTLVTTLYQNAFAGAPASEPCFVDGEKIKGFPTKEALTTEFPHWLIDNKKNGYYVHLESAPLKIMRHHQKWFYLWPDHLIDKKTDIMKFNPGVAGNPQEPGIKEVLAMPDSELEKYYKPTENNFALAYFDHGAKSENPDCIYSLLVRSTPKEMENFSESMADDKTAPYLILQKDYNAHILWDRMTKTTGYILFGGGWWNAPKIGGDPRKAALISVSRPCMAMIKELDGKLKMSVASTDWKDTSPMILTIKGDWALVSKDTEQECKVEAKDGSTRIEIDYKFEYPSTGYMPIHMTMQGKNGK